MIGIIETQAVPETRSHKIFLTLSSIINPFHFCFQIMERSLPNILVTGTPGTGKTTTSEMIAEATGLDHVNVGEIVKSKQLHEGYLEEFDTHVLDEDKVKAIHTI
jgi:Cdc6-like AAA superfamily ATPase